MVKSKNIPRDALLLLSGINRLTPVQRPILLNYLNDSGVDVLSGLIFNLLYNQKVNLKPKKKKEIKALLKERLDDYRKLASKKRSYSARRRIIKQSGGFIVSLLSATVPIIAELIAQAATRK